MRYRCLCGNVSLHMTATPTPQTVEKSDPTMGWLLDHGVSRVVHANLGMGIVIRFEELTRTTQVENFELVFCANCNLPCFARTLHTASGEVVVNCGLEHREEVFRERETHPDYSQAFKLLIVKNNSEPPTELHRRLTMLTNAQPSLVEKIQEMENRFISAERAHMEDRVQRFIAQQQAELEQSSLKATQQRLQLLATIAICNNLIPPNRSHSPLEDFDENTNTTNQPIDEVALSRSLLQESQLSKYSIANSPSKQTQSKNVSAEAGAGNVFGAKTSPSGIVSLLGTTAVGKNALEKTTETTTTTTTTTTTAMENVAGNSNLVSVGNRSRVEDSGVSGATESSSTPPNSSLGAKSFQVRSPVPKWNPHQNLPHIEQPLLPAPQLQDPLADDIFCLEEEDHVVEHLRNAQDERLRAKRTSFEDEDEIIIISNNNNNEELGFGGGTARSLGHEVSGRVRQTVSSRADLEESSGGGTSQLARSVPINIPNDQAMIFKRYERSVSISSAEEEQHMMPPHTLVNKPRLEDGTDCSVPFSRRYSVV